MYILLHILEYVCLQNYGDYVKNLIKWPLNKWPADETLIPCSGTSQTTELIIY